MFRVYVLNNSYDCVSTTTVGRALVLIKDGHADVVKWSEKVVRTAKDVLRIPLIIRIFRYVRAFGRALKFDRRFVWERDNYICQYCGVKIKTKAELSTDHIHPESKGGKAVYENMVTACKACNSKKDNKTCAEAHMFPMKKPVMPQMSRGMAKMADEARRLLAVLDKENG